MKYEIYLLVDEAVAVEMERIVQQPDSSVRGDGVEFDQEVVFDNGVRMAIQVCASGDPCNEPCWTQGVLFTSDGTEIGCTDVGESFLGEYNVASDNDEYIVHVIMKETEALYQRTVEGEK